MVTVDTFKRGLNKGLMTTWELTKIVVPVYIFVTFLSYTPVLNWVAEFCKPVMGLLGLPGEASLALVMGYTLNLYAALGVITGLSLTHKEITIIAVMLLMCHALFMETAISKRTGVSAAFIVTVRILISLISGFVLNLIL